ncbi:MAG: alkane 1-monooxygenase [Bacteroidetes bacterium]|nr:alkane 1-monooxygenase [Bacteroidota bacterium]
MSFRTGSLRYLAGLLPALGAASSFQRTGWGAWTLVFVVFFLIPILDQVFGRFKFISAREEDSTLAFDWVLYLTVPIYLFLYLYFLQDVYRNTYDLLTLSGRIVSMGLLCGVYGINVAHELGHRKELFPRLVARLLLCTSFYAHFYIEHNRGHHKHVATPGDPSSARKNEMLYTFWMRSMTMTWLTAWRIEARKMKNLHLPIFHYRNQMIVLLFAQLFWFGAIFYFFGYPVIIYILLSAWIGAALLETINYIEHYGLSRKQLESGVYERTGVEHSWNSDHVAGRFVLFELSRHSDHHYKASKHFPSLESKEGSPQMPLGYPGMMLISLIPPLWFAIMNPKLDKKEGLTAH